jgi:hypothetical protein
MHYYNTAYSKNGKKTIVAKVLCSVLYQNITNINIGKHWFYTNQNANTEI